MPDDARVADVRTLQANGPALTTVHLQFASWFYDQNAASFRGKMEYPSDGIVTFVEAPFTKNGHPMLSTRSASRACPEFHRRCDLFHTCPKPHIVG
jgi:hypothetical protein